MTPFSFWKNPPDAPGWQAVLLWPLAALYARATAARVARQPDFSATVPVICVGNINVGGTGKTPTVIALATKLQAWGYKVHIVSRGYGGKIAGPAQVDIARHTAADVGDEPLLLAAFTETWIARNRAKGVEAAQVAGAEVILLDDGFQNPSVTKNLNIVVVDAKSGFGNARVLPAGPLREPVDAGMKRADLLVSIGAEKDRETFRRTWSNQVPCPQFQASLEPLQTGIDWQGLRVRLTGE